MASSSLDSSLIPQGLIPLFELRLNEGLQCRQPPAIAIFEEMAVDAVRRDKSLDGVSCKI